MAGLEQITMEIEILDWEQTRKFHQFSSNSFHSFRLYHLAKRWKERCQGCEPCPGEECLLSLVDFLSQWVFFTFHFFGYKIMMLRVVWCLIVISFFSCHWAPSIHSAIWWPTWHLIWGGKNMLNKQYVCGRFLFVLKSNLWLTGTTGLQISPMGTLSSFRACGAWHKWVLNLAQWLQMNLKWIRVSVRTVKCLLMNLAQRSLC